MKILVTGGGGFIGSHVAHHYAEKGWDVMVYDNLSRGDLLSRKIPNLDYNIKALAKKDNVTYLNKDVCDAASIEEAAKDADVIFHAAAQTGVTSSLVNPSVDFHSNALGTFNVLEAARKSAKKPTVLYCSTNKVYGSNVNRVGIVEGANQYAFEEKYAHGLDESYDIDNCEHTPYGCSKLTGDLYMQDYALNYGLKTGVFRMSCIYGPRQFGVEDQGWVAWFTIATILGKDLTIYGDGKQVRDVLYISDLINLYDRFISSDIRHGVYNIGGGPKNTLSLLRLLDILKKESGKKSNVSFKDWRPSDQKVFIADISKAQKDLGWSPKISPDEGVQKLVAWYKEHKDLL